jgi:hypothetical protein
MNTAHSNERQMSREQRGLIFVLLAELGITAGLRHDIQKSVTGKTSLTDFTSADAAKMIDHLQRLSTRSGSNPAGRGYSTSSLQRDAGGNRESNGPPPAIPNNPGTAGFQPGPISGGQNGRKTVIGVSVPGCFGGTPPPSAPGGRAPRNLKSVKKAHRLPSPEQREVLERLFCFAGYLVPEARRAFTNRIIKRDRAHSMWEVETVIFALMAQAAPKMLEQARYLLGAPLSEFERGFLFTNRADKGGWNAVELELKEYIENKNKRGHRTMPRFSLTKFFEILEKYK